MQTASLHRKQYLVSDENLAKIAAIQAIQGKSAAEIVREAIEAYDPNANEEDPLTPEAVAFLAQEVRSAIKETQQTNEKVEALLSALSRPESEN